MSKLAIYCQLAATFSLPCLQIKRGRLFHSQRLHRFDRSRTLRRNQSGHAYCRCQRRNRKHHCAWANVASRAAGCGSTMNRVRLRPQHANHVWSYDFVSARTHDGRTVRMRSGQFVRTYRAVIPLAGSVSTSGFAAFCRLATTYPSRASILPR